MLVIEDEPKTARLLGQGLEENGIDVHVCTTGVDGLTMAVSQNYDVIVLDIMLPGVDGWTVLGALRQVNQRTPVLILSARDAVADRVKGLSLGADDYLIKPFEFSELLARLRVVARRGQAIRDDLVQFADMKLEPARMTALREGNARIPLTVKEYQLLDLLVRNQGIVFSKTVILDRVWNMNFDSDSNVVEVCVRRLRRKVDEPFERKLIHTVKGRGYVVR
ncbi:MAG: heavy metal response regulator transcription factor [Hyphomonadaceae bacterium]